MVTGEHLFLLWKVSFAPVDGNKGKRLKCTWTTCNHYEGEYCYTRAERESREENGKAKVAALLLCWHSWEGGGKSHWLSLSLSQSVS